jgi:hypothetical protein
VAGASAALPRCSTPPARRELAPAPRRARARAAPLSPGAAARPSPPPGWQQPHPASRPLPPRRQRRPRPAPGPAPPTGRAGLDAANRKRGGRWPAVRGGSCRRPLGPPAHEQGRRDFLPPAVPAGRPGTPAQRRCTRRPTRGAAGPALPFAPWLAEAFGSQADTPPQQRQLRGCGSRGAPRGSCAGGPGMGTAPWISFCTAPAEKPTQPRPPRKRLVVDAPGDLTCSASAGHRFPSLWKNETTLRVLTYESSSHSRLNGTAVL